MKLMIILALVAVALARPDDFYDTKYDNFNLDDIINNNRLLKSYADCFLGNGKCTPEGKDFKSWIPEGARSACGKCTDKQKILVARAMNAMKLKLPEEFDALIKQHDPNNEFAASRQEFLDKYL